MRIGVVGAGALGTEVTLRMAREVSSLLSGSTVVVIDPDHVEQRNIAMSRLFYGASEERDRQVVGALKAELVAEWLNRLSQQQGSAAPCRWVACPREIADLSWHALRSLDLLITCTDNALARLEATLAARCLGLPLLDGGVQGDQTDGGRVTCFLPEPEAACYLCGVGEERRAALLAFAAATSLPCTLPAEAALGSGPRVSASLRHTADQMLGEAQRLLEQMTQQPLSRPASSSWAVRLHATGAGRWQRERIALRRSSSCPWHTGMRAPLVSVAPDQCFAEVLDALAMTFVPRLQFAWPVCVMAVCRACGARDRQPRRVALVRRRGICAQCQTPDQLEPLQALASVGHNEAVAKMTPRQLGWADRQLLQVRPSLMFANDVVEGC